MGSNSKEYSRQHYLKNRDKYIKRASEYQKRYRKNARGEYLGACDCPICGKRGYKRLRRDINLKTGNEWHIHTEVQHQHSEWINGKLKTIHDGTCYLGMGRL